MSFGGICIYHEGKILIGCAEEEKVYLYPKMANRHGMIAGATGTGKTITLTVLAESFGDCGVPVFPADVKGDLAGMCSSGSGSESLQKRIDKLVPAETGFGFRACPTSTGTSAENRGCPCAPPCPRWGPCCSAVFWT